MAALATPTDSAAAEAASPWSVLERLIQELHHGTEAVHQVRCTLEAIREGTGADAAFWHPPAGRGTPIIVGDSGLSTADCKRLMAGVAEQPGVDAGRVLAVAEDDAGRPCDVAAVRTAAVGSAWLVAVRPGSMRPFRSEDLDLLGLARRLLGTRNYQVKLNARLQESLVGLIRCLSATLEAKDACTAGHSERVARIAKLLATRMKLPATLVHNAFLAGLLHDIGKMGVPDRVLQKPGPLTRKEFAIIQTHTVLGDEILSGVPQLDPLRPGVRNHHERYDGKGYPDGLAGDEIPLLGRLLAVADSCDAMMSARRYRPALAPPQIDALFRAGSGKQWDPRIVEHFMSCRDDIYPPIYRKGIDESAVQAVAHLAGSWEEGSSMHLKAFIPDGDADE